MVSWNMFYDLEHISFFFVFISFFIFFALTVLWTLPQVFFKHFACKNQLPGLSISGTLVENGLNVQELLATRFTCKYLF